MTRGTKYDHSADRAPLDTDPWQVGGYRILRRLGEGGMGVVYLAESSSRVKVAVKVIHRHLASDPDFRRRFRREVSATQRVARFSTAPVLDADVDGQIAYLVTEYVPGPTLFQAVRNQGPLRGSGLEGLAMSMAVALRAIHAADVIHRDLKPSNVLLSPVGPKVIDFGLAYLPDSSTHSITIMGTPAYMSPEHVRGLDVSAASDIFSWAGVVTFAASGQPPFGAGAGHEILYRVVHDMPNLPKLGGVLGDLVAKALSKDPAERPTAVQLVDILASGSSQELTRSLPPPDDAPAGGSPDTARPRTHGATATSPGVSGPPARPARKRSKRWAGVSTAAAVLVTAGVVVAWSNFTVVQSSFPQGHSAANPARQNPSPPANPDGRTGKSPVWTSGRGNPLLEDRVPFFVQPDTDATRQARTWSARGRTADAALMRALSQVPQAMWLAGGSPGDVTRTARGATTLAGQRGAVPVFVTNHIPGRDCWNGGADSSQSYRAWIDGLAEGLGNRPAVVVLEPSSLARAPGTAQCPQGGEAAAKQRYSDLSYAVESLGGLTRTAVYLDGGLDGWPGLADAATRLINAGLTRADGFYVNMVGYRPTDRSLQYGGRLSRCLSLMMASRATTCSSTEIAAVRDDAPGLPHFLVDTSRNAAGEWKAPAGAFTMPDEWCNPPGRGTGARPTTDTGSPLADAFLWLNSPGYSNGQCTRGTAGPADPVYGFVTPASGQWWPDLALDRAKNARPPLVPGRS